MKRIYLIFLIINTVTLIYSQSVWTGNAAVSGDKEFESYYSAESATGKYLGASNSFPGSTEVTVTNPRNGKSVSVSIVKRLSQPGLFLVLSPEAGNAIELPDDDILNVEVIVRRKNEQIFSSYSEDKPYSDDPDLNPSAEIIADSSAGEQTSLDDLDSSISSIEKLTEPGIAPPVETGVNEYIPPVVSNNEGIVFDEGYDPLAVLGEEGGSKSSEQGETVTIVDEGNSPVESAESDWEPEVPLPETYDSTDLPDSYLDDFPQDAIMASPKVIGETPEREIYSDPINTSIALAEPEMIESDLVEPEIVDDEFLNADIDDLLFVENPEKEPVIIEPEIEEFVVSEPADEPLVTESEEIVVVEPELSIEEPEVVLAEPEEIDPENVIYFLTPGDFRPPPKSENKKEKEKEKVKEKEIIALPVERSELEEMIVTELHNGGSYLQLGTYGSVDLLYSQIKQINDAYPSIVLTMGAEDNKLYKLLIGPISHDEKGIILTRFRTQGYSDAFLYRPR